MIDQAFLASPREGFLPASQRPFAGEDRPLPIGMGATNSQPTTVRNMLELLEVPLGAKVLDVGSGSGWTTALLAYLVGPTGSVLGVELEPALVRFGGDNLAACHRAWARIQGAIPGVLGAPDAGPFDRILVSAMADELPTELVDQLAPEGVMVAPVAGWMTRVRASTNGEPGIEHLGRYVFVPLRRP